MKFIILPGEYLFSEEGFHVLDERGMAQVADAEIEIEVTNEDQFPVIEAYQAFVRPQAETPTPEI